MSTTMVVTMASTPPTTTAPTKLSTTATTTTTSLPCCPNCGDSLPSPEETQAELSQAQARIAELEAQIRTLNEKATAAAERWAGYEEELTKLRSQDQGPPPPPPPKNDHMFPPGAKNVRGPDGLIPHPTRSLTSPNMHAGDRPLPLQRMNSVPVSHAQDTAPPDKTTRELLQALSREKHLRQEAEGRLTATSKEIEDLSVSLFEQANNMVADERRARAQLEERVGELEKRDLEKRRRLERLETALTRIKHVRTLLDE